MERLTIGEVAKQAQVRIETLRYYERTGVWQTCKAITPGIGVSILVAAKCPACWLAYAGLLTMPGVAWLLGETSLMLLTIGLLAIALVSLAYRAHDRWGYWPLGLGVVAATLILIEKWWLSSPWLLAVGIILLVGASLWNAWPRQTRTLDACVTCAPQASEGYMKAHN